MQDPLRFRLTAAAKREDGKCWRSEYVQGDQPVKGTDYQAAMQSLVDKLLES